MLKNKCSVWKRIKFPTFWYNCYYFTWSDTYFIQLETLLINNPSYIVHCSFRLQVPKVVMCIQAILCPEELWYVTVRTQLVFCSKYCLAPISACYRSRKYLLQNCAMHNSAVNIKLCVKFSTVVVSITSVLSVAFLWLNHSASWCCRQRMIQYGGPYTLRK